MSNGHGLTKENMLRTLPEALRQDESAYALATATAEILQTRSEELRLINIYSRIDELPEALLDILAYDFKVDWWDYDYTLEEKRRTLKSSWIVHKHLGTKLAVETALSAIMPNAKTEEWFEYGGEPYHFRVNVQVDYTGMTAAKQERALRAVEYYKNLRSHADEIRYTTEVKPAAMWGIGGVFARSVRRPIPEARDDTLLKGGFYLAGAASAYIRRGISEIPELRRFNGSLSVGGAAGAAAKTPVPERKENTIISGTVYANGRYSTKSTRPIAEIK